MEKFMYIFVENGLANVSAEQMQADTQKWIAWVERLRAKDRYVSGEPLLPGGRVLTASKKMVTDGPFTESKELVSGFFIVLAKDLTEATEMARECPIFEYDGAVQIRPVQQLHM